MALLLVGDNEEEQKELPIAWASVVLLDPFLLQDPLVEACDAESGDLFDLYCNIYDRDGNLLPPLDDQLLHETIWYLDEFIIEEEYQGVGQDFLKWIITYITRHEGAMVVLPVPSTIVRKGNIAEIVRDYDPKKLNYLRWFFAHFGFASSGILTTCTLYWNKPIGTKEIIGQTNGTDKWESKRRPFSCLLLSLYLS